MRVLRMETPSFSACPVPPILSAFPRFLIASARCPFTADSKHSPSSPQYCCYRLSHPALTSPHGHNSLLCPYKPHRSPLPLRRRDMCPQPSGFNGDRDGSDESHTREGTPRGERSTRGIIHKNFLPLSSILYDFCREVALLICPIPPIPCT